jgi:hypothetical protein
VVVVVLVVVVESEGLAVDVRDDVVFFDAPAARTTASAESPRTPGSDRTASKSFGCSTARSTLTPGSRASIVVPFAPSAAATASRASGVTRTSTATG